MPAGPTQVGVYVDDKAVLGQVPFAVAHKPIGEDARLVPDPWPWVKSRRLHREQDALDRARFGF